MASTTKGPRIVDLLAEIARELRLANRLRALAQGPSAWEHDTTTKATTPTAIARRDQRNALRVEVRAGLGIEEGTDD